jgi:hypothetical protein
MVELTKCYYRVTKDDCVRDTIIKPSGHSSSQDTEVGQKIEELLEQARLEEFPSKPSHDCAQRYWWRMTSGRIYIVRIESDDHILHRSDMMLLHEIENILNNGGDAMLLARQYWRGEPSPKPCEELMVLQAKVIEDVTPSDKTDVFRRLYKISCT